MSELDSGRDGDLSLRTPTEVARRSIILYAIVAAGHREPREAITRWLQREGLWEAVTPEEAAFLESQRPTREQMINATWQAEALLPFLWSLKKIESLPAAVSQCDLPAMRKVLPPLFGPTIDFILEASLRDWDELSKAYEEIYDTNWLVRDAEINNRPIPRGLNPEIIEERHRALNWILCLGGESWDEITTDT